MFSLQLYLYRPDTDQKRVFIFTEVILDAKSHFSATLKYIGINTKFRAINLNRHQFYCHHNKSDFITHYKNFGRACHDKEKLNLQTESQCKDNLTLTNVSCYFMFIRLVNIGSVFPPFYFVLC